MNKQSVSKHMFPYNVIRGNLARYLKELGCTGGCRILEIGCGTGESTRFITEVSSNVVGLDVSRGSLKEYCKQGWVAIQADAHYLPFKDGIFDYVVYSLVLHHVVKSGDIAKCVEESRRVVKVVGYVIALEPNLFYPSGVLMNIFNSVMPGITGLDPVERAIMPCKLMLVFRKAGLANRKCVSASFTWNRLPLIVSKFLARLEDHVRYKMPFNMLGWFIIVSGQKKE